MTTVIDRVDAYTRGTVVERVLAYVGDIECPICWKDWQSRVCLVKDRGPA